MLNKKVENIEPDPSKNIGIEAFVALSIDELEQKIKTIDVISASLESNQSSIASCLKALCSATLSGYWLFDIKQECVWFSEELLDLLQLPKDKNELLSIFENQYIQNEEKNKLFESLYKFIHNKNEREFELRIKNPKNQKILLNTLSVIENNNFQIIGIVKDITQQVQYEEELAKQKEKAIESDKVKSVFLKNISHEIRTPMNSIVGFIELLDVRDFSTEKRQEFLSIIKNKSKYLLSLIDDIAELSKFESGNININKSETNLSKLLNELLIKYNLEKSSLKKQNIDLFLHLPTDLKDTTAYTDPGRIQQVMSYLLDNAIKYTEKGYVQFGYEIKDNKNIVFFVKDTGIGIPKEEHKYLFNRFRINEDTIDPKHNHTGLGLTISRAIVEQLGGKISVDSAPGQGSTFSFTIPIVKLEKISSPLPVEEKQGKVNWRNKVILVAEDDDVNYHFLEAVLADSQARLIHVHNGQQAIELCHTLTNIDLILMDIRMPEKNGHDAVREIKKFRKEIPIIAQTAYTGKEEREKCLQTGCDDYISKPIDIEVLINKINTFLAE